MKFIKPLSRRWRAFVLLIVTALLLGVTANVATAAPSIATTATANCSSTTLKQGSRGSCVKELQTALNAAGHSAGSVDGAFGPKTKSAVVGFQKKHRLAVDGVVGPQTWGKLLFTNRAAPKPTPTKCSSATLKRGNKGSCVSELQSRLVRASFAVGRYGSDGDFGPGTQTAVKEFQQHYNLTADGVVGPKTWSKLIANPAAPASRLKHLSGIKGWAGVNIVADKSDRKAYVFRDGALLRVIDVRFGGRGVEQDGTPYQKSTPVGSFRVEGKVKDEVSRTYNDAEMPYTAYFIVRIGVGFHYSANFRANGYGDGTLGSHGCVNIGNLPDAKFLYETAPLGARVVVQN